MDTKKVLAERERLRGEAKRAQATKHEHEDQVAKLGHELQRLEQRRETAMQAAARTGTADELEQLNADEERLRQQLRDADARFRASAMAQNQAQRELVELHGREFEAFAAHARGLSEKAVALRDKLREAYVDAFRAWEAARSEWHLLARDVGLDGRSASLPQPADIFGLAAPEVQDTRGSTASVIYYALDGQTMSASVGSSLHQVLAESEDWHLLEDGQEVPQAPPGGPNPEVVVYQHQDGRTLSVYAGDDAMRAALDGERAWRLLDKSGELAVDTGGVAVR